MIKILISSRHPWYLCHLTMSQVELYHRSHGSSKMGFNTSEVFWKQCVMDQGTKAFPQLFHYLSVISKSPRSSKWRYQPLTTKRRKVEGRRSFKQVVTINAWLYLVNRNHTHPSAMHYIEKWFSNYNVLELDVYTVHYCDDEKKDIPVECLIY